MVTSAEDLAPSSVPAQPQERSGSGPQVEEASWGYIIRGAVADSPLHAVGRLTGRFVGVILLMAGAGFWMLPNALHGAEVVGIKIAAMVMFSVFGGYFLWAGRRTAHPEFRIDKTHREIRIGYGGKNDEFCQTARVDFHEVSSVFLLRSENRPTRLFLRLADLRTGIEITSGSRARMEALKQRLTDDLTGQIRQPLGHQLRRHQTVAA